MMRLPARLTAKLAKVRIAQTLSSTPANSLMYFVDPADVLHRGSSVPVSHEKMQSLIENAAPVIWIGSDEVLVHPGIGHFVRAIAQSGHFVFLETDGALLRRRIHEFQPLPQLFLTVRLSSLQAPESAPAIEGLRVARLSGFFTVAHSLVRQESVIGQLHSLRSFLLERDVDGWLITAGGADKVAAENAAEARELIPAWFWRRFSEGVEKMLLTQTQSKELCRPSTIPADSTLPQACEKRVRVA